MFSLRLVLPFLLVLPVLPVLLVFLFLLGTTLRLGSAATARIEARLLFKKTDDAWKKMGI